MPFEVVNVGAAPNDDTGDTLRNGGVKINNNFTKAVEGPASATDGRVAVFDGTGGKVIKNGTKVEADLVVGPASTVNNNRMVVFDQTTGRLVKQAAFVENDVNRLGTEQTITAIKRHTQSTVVESNAARAIVMQRSNDANTASRFVARKSRGSVAVPTNVLDGDALGRFDFDGHDGTDFVVGASILSSVDGTPSGVDNMPTNLRFATKPGAGGLATRMTIAPNGNVGIGTASPSSLVEIAGNNNAVTENNTLRFNDTDTTTQAGQQVGRIEFFSSDTSSPGAGVKAFIAAVAAQVNPNVYLSFGTDTTTGTPTERFRIAPAGGIHFPSVGTTASAANAFLDNAATPANQLLRSTSSIRYKTSVETLEREYADNVLALRPVWYRSLAEADRADWSWYGLIAEEVAAVEPRLVHWTYPESAYEEVAVEGGEGAVERVLKADAELVPDGVQYERLAVLLLDVVQRQQVAIDELRARVEGLSGG
jgi:hypothetical protein